MPKNIGTPKSITAQERREVFRIEVEVGGTDAAPEYQARAHAALVTRDDAGNEIGRKPGHVTVQLKLKPKLRQAIADIIADADGED